MKINPRPRYRTLFLRVACAFIIMPLPAFADPAPHSLLHEIFQDHAVLQRDQPIKVWGDSIAGDWFTPLQKIATERHWELITDLHSVCPLTATVMVTPDTGGPYTPCHAWGAAVRDRAVRAALRRGHDPRVPGPRWRPHGA